MSRFIRHVAAFCLTLFVSCAERPLQDVPGSTEKGAVSVAELKTLYSGAPYRITEEFFVACHVTANDRSGSFYRTLTVGDLTGGIQIKIASDRLWEDYWIGDCLTVYCAGLTLGAYGGAISLGGNYGNGYENTFLQAEDFRRRVTKSGWLSDAPEPTVTEVRHLEPSLINVLVRFENMTVATEDQNKCWAENGMPTERHFTDVAGDTLVVRTRPQADFAHLKLPTHSCDLTGIMEYFAGTYHLVLRDWYDVRES